MLTIIVIIITTPFYNKQCILCELYICFLSNTVFHHCFGIGFIFNARIVKRKSPCQSSILRLIPSFSYLYNSCIRLISSVTILSNCLFAIRYRIKLTIDPITNAITQMINISFRFIYITPFYKEQCVLCGLFVFVITTMHFISSFWFSDNIITQKARVLADSALELVYSHLNIDPNDFPGVVVKV